LPSHDSSPENPGLGAEALALPDGRSLHDLRSHYDARPAPSPEEVLTRLQGMLRRIHEQTREMDDVITAALRRQG
jgi:hypothetical protein